MMRLEDNTTQALGRVLLVEDDQSIRRVLRFSLWEAGFDIIEVVTGAEALQTLENDVPEVVVLDLGLPDGLGGTVLKWLRQAEHNTEGGPVWPLGEILPGQAFQPLGTGHEVAGITGREEKS
jgi:CheY-like chemotaxis protein